LNDADLRAYLLGQTTEPDAERLEIRALEDEDFFSTVRSVEDDLFDEYVRGAMADHERPLFLARYGGDQERLRMARALMTRTSQPPVASRSTASKYWMMAAAAVLVVGIGLTLGIPGKPTTGRPTAPVAASTPAPAAPAPAPIALLLTLGTSRSAAPPPEALLPSSAVTLQLHVRIDPADTFDGYTMELHSDNGNVIWRADTLKASAAGGDLTLVGDVPAALLKEAGYELTVLGSTAGRPPEVLGFAAVKIRR
jgi:hypothetical protein